VAKKTAAAPTKRILFVEDQPDDTFDEILLAIQEQCPDWEMDFAGGVEDAWDLLCKNVYDAFVLDVMLPHWPASGQRSEGLFLARALRAPEFRQTAQLPPGTLKPENARATIVFLTARNAEGVWKEIGTLSMPGVARQQVIGKFDGDAVQLAKGIVSCIRDKAAPVEAHPHD